jgi:type I restriction enzyme S subunit
MTKWSSIKLGDIADIKAGVTLGREILGPAVTMPYLRVANVQDGYLNLNNIKQVEIFASEENKWLLKPGDILLTEGGDWDKLGRGTVWQGEIEKCIHQNHIFRVRVDLEEFDPYFLSMFIGSPYGKRYFQKASKQTTNLASINQKQLRAFKVFKPPLLIQRQIVDRLRGLQLKIDEIKLLQEKTERDIEELFPSILKRAFAGKL